MWFRESGDDALGGVDQALGQLGLASSVLGIAMVGTRLHLTRLHVPEGIVARHERHDLEVRVTGRSGNVTGCAEPPHPRERSSLGDDLGLDADGTRHRVRDEAALVRLVDELAGLALVAAGADGNARAQQDLGHAHLPVGNG